MVPGCYGPLLLTAYLTVSSLLPGKADAEVHGFLLGSLTQGVKETPWAWLRTLGPCLVPSLPDKLPHHPPEPPEEGRAAPMVSSSQSRSEVTTRSKDTKQWHPPDRPLKTAYPCGFGSHSVPGPVRCRWMVCVALPMWLIVFLPLLSFPVGDAPFCTPEQHKECAEPALGQYWGEQGEWG